MCGFVAIVRKKGKVDVSELLRLQKLLLHRGPDDNGVFISDDGRIGFAHNRLSIIDLSPAGHQPMISSDGRYVLIYNGEIYNFLELKEKFLPDHEFYGTSDSEVLLRLFSVYGPKMLRYLNGMWAFLIYDTIDELIYISRDRYGIKPLYYMESDNEFVFSSEIKPILSYSGYHFDINDSAILTFLSTGVIDGLDETTFSKIFRFPPAHYAILDIKDKNNLNFKRYYQVGKHFKVDVKNLSTDDVIGIFRKLFFDSVRIRLRSDVELGVALSGGLDSSSIFAVASIISGKNINSFSTIYSGKEFDESYYYNLINKKYNAIKHEITPVPANFIEKYKTIVWKLEEPNKSMGVFSQWHIFQLASQYVTVMLNGQGGDEVLGGYFPYFIPFLADVLHKTPYKFLSELIKIHKVTGLPISKIVRDIVNSAIGKRPTSVEIFQPSILKHAKNLNLYSHDIPYWISGFLNRRLYNDLTYLMLPNFLRYEDRISMSFSMESRLPFLDYRIVDFLFGLPFYFKIRHGWTKWILRKAMEGILPPEIQWRRDKKGFPTPFQKWLKDEKIVKRILDTKILHKYVRKYFIEDTMNCALRGSRYCIELVWRFINVELWYEVFF